MAIGAAASIFVLNKLGIEPGLSTTVIGAFGALLPDADHPKSLINQKLLLFKNKFGKIAFYCGIGGYLIYQNNFQNDLITALGLISFMIGASPHRKFTHSIITLPIISFILVMLIKPYVDSALYIAFIVGILSHLIDYFTNGGIEALYPITDKRYSSFISIKTNGFVEALVMIGASFYVIHHFWIY